MKALTFSLLLIALLVLSPGEVWGQGTYEGVWSAPHNTETTRSITRAWGNKAQITFIQDIEYDPYYANVILNSTAKFVFSDPNEDLYRVAKFDNSYWPRVNDFEIVGDTLYFCGYANTTASSASPEYLGFIGYFDIPRLFSGTDVIHVLTFNQQTLTLGGIQCHLNSPAKIEVFNVDNGTHIVCTGGWDTTSSTRSAAGNFIADVVHDDSTGNWWYYVHLDFGNEVYSDVAVTDNYVMTIAPKATLRCFYLRVFTKPQSVHFHPSDEGRDPSIFDTWHRTPPYQSYNFMWTDNVESGDGCHHCLKIRYPLLIHTNGDTVALSYLTYAWNDRHIYGPTVKVIDIADMLNVPHMPSGGVVPVDPNNGSGGGIGPDPDPLTPIAPTLPVLDPALIVVPPASDTVKLYYNRIVDLQDTSQSPQPIDANAQWSVHGLVYDSVSRCVLVLHHQSYASGYYDSAYAIDAFPIDYPANPIRRYHLTDPNRPLHSLSDGLSSDYFCISGNPSTTDQNLLFGSIKTSHYNCVLDTLSIPTQHHRGYIDDIINRINHSPHFGMLRIPPTRMGRWNAAFNAIVQSVTIIKYEKK